MSNIEQCLKCLDFPCTCGHQYQNMTDTQIETIIFNLQNLLKKRGHTINNWLIDEKIISEYANQYSKQARPLFSSEFMNKIDKWFPTPWIIMLKTEKNFKVLWMKLQDANPDDIPLPGIFMMCLYIKYITVENKSINQRFITLFEDLLKRILVNNAINDYLNDYIYNHELKEKIKAFNTYGLVDTFTHLNEYTGKLAKALYNIYVQVYDHKNDYCELVESVLHFFEIYTGINNQSDHTPRTLVNKYNEEWYYFDDEILKVMNNQNDNFSIDNIFV